MKKKILIISTVISMVVIAYCNVYSQTDVDVALKNYRPISIYHTPKSTIVKAAFPVIDMHSHNYASTQNDIDEWVHTMDDAGIEKTILLTCATGKSFDSVVAKYKSHADRFDLWCGFDYSGFGQEGWEQNAVKELERCYKQGARGVGELGDKGEGEQYSIPSPGYGVHIDDIKMKPLLKKCAQLNMPVSIHVAEDEWMYAAPDSTNDGMMNAAQWHVNANIPGKLNHDELVSTLENAVRENPETIFIACHLANCCSNLEKMGNLLEKYPNLYADIAARFAEISPVPRYTAAFITKYQDRLVYGTDMGTDASMYAITYRILESADEHFYEIDLFNYHWPLYGLNLPTEILKKLYHTNAMKILNQ